MLGNGGKEKIKGTRDGGGDDNKWGLVLSAVYVRLVCPIHVCTYPPRERGRILLESIRSWRGAQRSEREKSNFVPPFVLCSKSLEIISAGLDELLIIFPEETYGKATINWDFAKRARPSFLTLRRDLRGAVAGPFTNCIRLVATEFAPYDFVFQ